MRILSSHLSCPFLLFFPLGLTLRLQFQPCLLQEAPQAFQDKLGADSLFPGCFGAWDAWSAALIDSYPLVMAPSTNMAGLSRDEELLGDKDCLLLGSNHSTLGAQ